MFLKPTIIDVKDARPLLARGELSLDTTGFVLLEHKSECKNFRDKAMVRRVYFESVLPSKK